VEPTLQAATGGLLLDLASWMYINTQTTVTVGALLWIYLPTPRCRRYTWRSR